MSKAKVFLGVVGLAGVLYGASVVNNVVSTYKRVKHGLHESVNQRDSCVSREWARYSGEHFNDILSARMFRPFYSATDRHVDGVISGRELRACREAQERDHQ